jgi:hypothetical protein
MKCPLASTPVGDGTCQFCPQGTYMFYSGDTACSDCPAGTYTETVGSTGCLDCPTGKTNAPGSRFGNSSCSWEDCGSCKSKLYHSSCSPQRYSDTITNSTVFSNCGTCPAGRYLSNSTCVLCTVGLYTAESNYQNSCDLCPEGKYSNSAGATECISCSGNTTSASGNPSCDLYRCSTGDSGYCTACAVGSFLNVSSGMCTLCPAGTYSNSVLSITCTECPIGSYSEIEGASECTTCPDLSTSISAGATSCDFIGCHQFKFDTSLSGSFYAAGAQLGFSDQNFSDAHDSCLLLNSTFGYSAYLAVLANLNIARALTLMFDIPEIWVGLEQSNFTDEPKGGWFWSDGTLASYQTTAWNVGEPNNSGEGENCAMMYFTYGNSPFLNDAECKSFYPFICEYSGKNVHQL